MITIEANYAIVLIASNAIILGLACYVLARFERRCRKIEVFWSSPTGVALTDDSDTESREGLRITQQLEERVGELQRAVKVLALNKQSQTQATIAGLPIENAVRMAKHGASVEDLTASCGLNIGEARLMQKLHGKAEATAADRRV